MHILFEGQVHVFAGWVKIVSHSSCRTSVILKYFCPLYSYLLSVSWKSTFTKTMPTLTLCLLGLSADNLCKQFGLGSGSTKCRAWSGSKLFDTLMVFLKDFFLKKNDFEKTLQTTKIKHEKLPSSMQLVTLYVTVIFIAFPENCISWMVFVLCFRSELKRNIFLIKFSIISSW